MKTEYGDPSCHLDYALFEERRETAVRVPHSVGIYHRFGKRALDLALVLLIAPIAVPFVFLIWLVTKQDGGSGFFPQTRVGKDGREFRCWKIRTMIPDAAATLDRLVTENPQIASEWRATQKLENDPRITRFGRLLRKTSMDEIPQLWNVFCGDMSLIGPRPFTPDQKHIYDSEFSPHSYYLMRPGISGPWQVDCRNSGQFLERVGFDDAYFQNLTLTTDLRIALKTCLVVLQATGK